MGSRRSFVWTVCTPTVSRSENRPMCKGTRTAVDFAGKCGSHAVSHCRLPGHSGDVFLFLLLTGPHGASATHSRMHWRVQVHAFRLNIRSHPCPSAHPPIVPFSECRMTYPWTRLAYSATALAFLTKKSCGFDINYRPGLSHDDSSLSLTAS